MKEIIKKLFLNAGLEVKMYNPLNSPRALLQKIILQNSIDLVIDVGANAGQYATNIRELGYKSEIISFEPLNSVYKKLSSKANQDKNWRAENFAIGVREEEGVIHVSENTFSSSILDIKDAHVSAAPQARYIGEEKIKIAPLSKFITPEILAKHKSIWLKMDVQGYEMNVLESAASLLPKIKVVQAELSFVPMYSNGPLYRDIVAKMESSGFELFTFIPEFIDPNSAKLLQAEGIFLNTQLSK